MTRGKPGAPRSDRANESRRSLALHQFRLRLRGPRPKPGNRGRHKPALLVWCGYEKEIRLARAHLSRFPSPRENAERCRSRGIDGTLPLRRPTGTWLETLANGPRSVSELFRGNHFVRFVFTARPRRLSNPEAISESRAGPIRGASPCGFAHRHGNNLVVLLAPFVQKVAASRRGLATTHFRGKEDHCGCQMQYRNGKCEPHRPLPRSLR